MRPGTTNVAVVTDAERASPGTSLWVVGVARNAKLGAVVEAGRGVVYCGGRDAWPPELEGRPIVVAGTVTVMSVPAPPIGPRGERSAGAEGEMRVLRPCAVPPPAADADLLDAERAVFAALARKDAATMARLVAPEFVLRMPGKPDTDRTGFLQGVAGLPGEIVAVEGEALEAHRAEDTGIVRGIQVARVRVDGKVVQDRGAFVDVFAWRDGAWVMTFSLSAPLSP